MLNNPCSPCRVDASISWQQILIFSLLFSLTLSFLMRVPKSYTLYFCSFHLLQPLIMGWEKDNDIRKWPFLMTWRLLEKYRLCKVDLKRSPDSLQVSLSISRSRCVCQSSRRLPFLQTLLPNILISFRVSKGWVSQVNKKWSQGSHTRSFLISTEGLGFSGRLTTCVTLNLHFLSVFAVKTARLSTKTTSTILHTLSSFPLPTH